MGTRRARGLLVAGMILAMLLVGRLFYIQVMGHEDLSKAAVGQYIVPIEGLDCRGIIYDRNMVPLTGGTTQYFYIVPAERMDSNLSSLLSCLDARKVGGRQGQYQVYRTETFDQVLNERLIQQYNSYGFRCAGRYSDNQIAAHIIGYINSDEQKGVAGIELMKDDILTGIDRSLCLYGDSKGNILKEFEITTSIVSSGVDIEGQGADGVTNHTLKPNTVVTTIDSRIQALAERILDQRKVHGSVVVLKTKTGEILACASTPAFNPNKLDEHLGNMGDELINKATQGVYSPGSVFKIIVAAAALDSTLCDEKKTFECKGHVTINGVTLKCETGGDAGHGTINMAQALAQSCNCYFAQLGQLLGSEKIIEMAQKMGLGKATIVGFPEESSGVLPEYSERIYSGLSNLSIGQGTLGVTPMQVARFTNIIANDGLDTGVHLIAGEAEKSLQVWGHSPMPGQGEAGEIMEPVVSLKTSTTIRTMMEDVMSEGTGKSAITYAPCGGKTGSAEASISGVKVIHGWFTGYFPAENPMYTITVFVEKGGSGSGSALPIFTQIVNGCSDIL